MRQLLLDMKLVLALDVSASMRLNLFGEKAADATLSRLGISSAVAVQLCKLAKKSNVPRIVSLYSISAINARLADDIADEAEAAKMLATQIKDGFGYPNIGNFLEMVQSEQKLQPMDQIIIFTDATTYTEDINFFAPCECRFVIVNKALETINPMQLEELTEISADSCGLKVCAENEEFYRLFQFADYTSHLSLVGSIATELFAEPVYNLQVGNLTANITLNPSNFENRPLIISTVGFTKNTVLKNLPVASIHEVICTTEDKALIKIMVDALKEESMIALVKFGSGRFGFLAASDEENTALGVLNLALLPVPAELPPYIPNLNSLTNRIQSDENYTPLEAPDGLPIGTTENLFPLMSNDGLQNDVNKVIRNFRKLPDRTDQFYAELNRVREYSAVIGCQSIVSEVAKLLKNEAQLLNEQVRKHAAYVVPLLEADITQVVFAAIPPLK